MAEAELWEGMTGVTVGGKRATHPKAKHTQVKHYPIRLSLSFLGQSCVQFPWLWQ